MKALEYVDAVNKLVMADPDVQQYVVSLSKGVFSSHHEFVVYLMRSLVDPLIKNTRDPVESIKGAAHAAYCLNGVYGYTLFDSVQSPNRAFSPGMPMMATHIEHYSPFHTRVNFSSSTRPSNLSAGIRAARRLQENKTTENTKAKLFKVFSTCK